MARYATGKNSFSISDRSGFRYRYRDMRKEWTGALVGKDEWEPKHPQLGPFRKVFDPEALKDARPDRIEPLKVLVGDGTTVVNPNPNPTSVYGQVGSVTVSVT